MEYDWLVDELQAADICNRMGVSPCQSKGLPLVHNDMLHCEILPTLCG